MLGGSFLLAMLSTRFPSYRWCINLGGGGLLLGVTGYWLLAAGSFGWGNFQFALRDFWESPQSWPLIFGVTLLGKTMFWGMLLLLIYGIWFLRCQFSEKDAGTRNSLVKRVFITVFVLGMIFMTGNLTYRHAKARVNYYEILLLEFIRPPRFNTDEKHLQKTLAIADMLIRDSKQKDRSLANVYPARAHIYICQQKYDEAIEDYREAIRIWTPLADLSKGHRNSVTTFYAFLGEAQLAKRDYSEAVSTLTAILEESRTGQLWQGLTFKNILLNRGYAYEKLGDIEAAIKDYTEVIDAIEQRPSKQFLETFVPREGYGEKFHQVHGKFGYGIRLRELKDVRDRLVAEHEK